MGGERRGEAAHAFLEGAAVDGECDGSLGVGVGGFGTEIGGLVLLFDFDLHVGFDARELFDG